MISFLNKIFLLEILILLNEGNIFSDIYLKNLELKKHIVISMTASKKKMKYLVVDDLIKSLLNQTIPPYRIILSINKANMPYLSNYLKLLAQRNVIELILVKEDLKNFNQYYYIPDEYKKYIIIIIEDNIILEKNFIEKLFKSYKLFPNAVSANRVFKMNFDENWILKPFNCWDEDYKKEKNPLFSLFAIHGSGSLFPPNTLYFQDDFISYFKKILYSKDTIIKYFELQKNLKTVYAYNNNKYPPLDAEFYEKYNNLITIFPDEFQLKEDFGNKYNNSVYINIIKEKVEIPNISKEYFLTNINNNTISEETLLVSMISSHERINGIFEVFLSLLYQTADISSYKCFLILLKEEFINGEKDLPLEIQKLSINRWIQIIWNNNKYSHNNLIPILLNYPENDILIVDDDIIRTSNFIEIFQKDHKLNPTDIICGSFMYYIDNNIRLKKLNGYKDEINRDMNPVPNIIFQTAFPSFGVDGILYPKHTFSDKRFFNESLYMNLTSICDESWQYAFNIIENKTLRQTSIIIDNSINIVKGQSVNSWQKKLEKTNNLFINDDLISIFPEYLINSLGRQKKLIVSLTSYKTRLKRLNLVLESIFNNTMKPSKIILTLYKKDLTFLTEYLHDLINNKIIELIVAEKDLKSHKKYFEVMKRYRDYAIITIDDDIIYTNDLIESLYNSYLKYPNCIHARRVHKIMTQNNTVLPYNRWQKQYTMELNPSFYLFATSGGGALFPPNILNISDDNVDEIYKCLTADDIYLKYLSRKKNIKIVWVPNEFCIGKAQLKDKNTQRNALYNINVKGRRLNDIYLKRFPVI